MIRQGLCWVLLVVFCGILYAAPPSKPPVTTMAISHFDVKSANRTLDKLSIQLSIENLNIRNLENATEILTQLQTQAKICVTQTQEQINKLDALWEESKAGNKEPTKLTPLQKYLQERKQEISTQRSACKLFVLRSDEAITAYTKTVKKLSAKALFAVEPNFWTNFINSIKAMKTLSEQFDEVRFANESGWELINSPLSLIILGTMCLMGLMMGFVLYRFISGRLSQLKIIETFSDKLRLAYLSTLKRYVIPFSVLAFLTIDIVVVNYLENFYSYLSAVSTLLCAYLFILMLLSFFFCPFRSLQSISGLPENITRSLLFRLKLLTTLCFIGLIVYLLFHNQNYSLASINLVHTLFITLLSINIISILWLINRAPKLLQYYQALRFMISLTLSAGLMTLIVAEWMGYQPLVTYILRGLTLTLFFAFIAWMLHKLIIGLLQAFTNNESPLPELLRYQLGVRKYETIPELIWLHIIFVISIWGGFALVLLKAWKLSEAQFRAITDTLINGFQITGMHIVPLKIFSGFIFFVLTYLLIRWIRNLIEQKHGDKTDPGAQLAFAAIFSYASIAIILLVALLIAGVNFAGLAIIAGALSVGIGFGLQNIVNNFLSGIILLLERPIKPGDRIMVGEVEGFVKRIRLRATQIRTLKYSDLIVPNSEIISQSVTNLMYHDTYGRVHISVGVAYGSNVELVQKVLLEIAHAHPEVVKDDPMRQSVVLFNEFGDSTLKFDMYCVTRNVNLNYLVKSELNVAVEKAFRQHHITIAFPQQDIYIKEFPGK